MAFWIRPQKFTLEEQKVDVWRVRSADHSSMLPELASLLSTSESQRAYQYISKKDSDSFVLGRGILRLLCGKYLQVQPNVLQFSSNDYDKPYLNFAPLYFNLSHAGEWIVYAFSANPFVGIDIEEVRPIDNMHNIVAYYFSLSEAGAFQQIAPQYQLEAFFRCWTRKEAYIKAIGSGLSLSLKSFDVSLTASDTSGLLRTEHKANCRLEDIQVADGYIGCLAIENTTTNICFYDIPPLVEWLPH